MNPIQRLNGLGQSVWLDYIRRDLIESGELAARIDAGEVRGVTSNPTIFEHAIRGSDLYTADLRAMAHAGWDAERIFDQLSLDDVRAATRAFLPLYESTNGQDGFVSVEVNPRLADDASGTVAEARRLWRAVNRPNVMIKIPATKAAIPAIEQTLREGMNINVTLIFSLNRYEEVIEAYFQGLEARQREGGALDHVASVASFFISRVDSAVDLLLEEVIRSEGPDAARASALLGKAAISNAKLAYAQFNAAFSSERYAALAQRGANIQRPLWASTSTKNPAYPDTYYIDNLIGPHTVNTIPPDTLEKFRARGSPERTLESNLSAARAQLEALGSLSISMREVTEQLEREGVAKFAESFTALLSTLRKRANSMRKELGPMLPEVQATIARLNDEEVGRRIWGVDTTLWTQNPAAAQEIQDRLGWLRLPSEMDASIDGFDSLRDACDAEGIAHFVLLGMGGSSLAPDVFRRTLAGDAGQNFYVLDTTDPAEILRVTRRVPLNECLFIVASKSGTTTEPLALLEHFWAKLRRTRGDQAGDRFVAITDPGTPLEALARERGFRGVYPAPSDVGGRYSALSEFGLLPAVLLGMDAREMLRGAKAMAGACRPAQEAVRNPGLNLGAILGTAARLGRDKLTFVADPDLAPFVDWIEQLVAESSGKEGLGMLPVVGEPPAAARLYAQDRLFIYLRASGAYDRRVRGWVRADQPVAVLEMDPTTIGFGRAFFQWEFATAAFCHLLGVNAFDQPDVQRAKDRTNSILSSFQARGSLPKRKTVWQGGPVLFHGDTPLPRKTDTSSLEGVFRGIFNVIQPGAYVATLVYLKPESALEKRVLRVRKALRKRLRVATTLGFGPRYLHSTGQYHKGGGAGGLFFIITAEPARDLNIPEMGVSFGVLEQAQALGDLQALSGRGRRAYGIHLASPARLKEVTAAMLTALDTM